MKPLKQPLLNALADSETSIDTAEILKTNIKKRVKQIKCVGYCVKLMCYCWCPLSYLLCLPLLDIPLIVSEYRFKKAIESGSAPAVKFFAPCISIRNLSSIFNEADEKLKELAPPTQIMR